VAAVVNAELALLYWRVGARIRADVLQGRRAEYGTQIMHALCAQLTAEFGTGYSLRNLFNMVRFSEVFPNKKIVHTLCGQLSWSHIRPIIYVDDPLARAFYAEMARLERWSVRTLESRIRKLREAIALARQRANCQ
jgi:hypothetical protein